MMNRPRDHAGIFRFKTLLSNTESENNCANYEKRIPWEKTTKLATNSLNMEKI